MDITQLSIHEALARLKTGDITAVELTRAVLDRIEQLNDPLNAYITVDANGALAQAKTADKKRADGSAGPLAGIPIGLKDVICTSGVLTTCGSKILQNFVPPYDAHVVKRLKKADAVLLGKLNMDEFAMGSSNENSAYGPVKNPWNLAHAPGGSSGGAAAAVAADLCLGALGSDTGGSIRQPASFCGITGLKPTYGRVSRFGLVAYASSLDQIGPMTGNVTDAALMLNVIAGYDAHDSTSVDRPVDDYTSFLTKDLSGLTIGIPEEYFNTPGLDPEVAQAMNRAIETLKALGAEFIDVMLPHTQYALATYYIIAPVEASANLARYDGVKYGFRASEADHLAAMTTQSRTQGFGPEVQRRIILGTYALSSGYYDAYYGKASQVRTLIMEDFKKAFTQCDLLVAPVAPTPSFKLGEKVDDPLTMYLSDIFTLSVNLAGIPAMSVPCGLSSDGLPIGLQLMGPHFAEGPLLKAAYAFEQATYPETIPSPLLDDLGKD